MTRASVDLQYTMTYLLNGDIMEVNGAANILMLLKTAGNTHILPDLREKLERQANMLVTYMRKYEKDKTIAWHDILEEYKNENTSN